MTFPSFDFAAEVAKGAFQFPPRFLLSSSLLSFDSGHSAVQLWRYPKIQLSYCSLRQLRWTFERSFRTPEKIPIDE